MTMLRRVVNHIDRRLDRQSLAEVADHSQQWPGGGVPCTAAAALERAVHHAHTLDRNACLKQLVAPKGTQSDGAAQRWEFRFELPEARAVLTCDWFLDGDARAGRFGRERLECRATPFPAPDSVLALGVAEGRLGYSSLGRAWREERRRTPDLPLVFRDSDAALADLQRFGFSVGRDAFTLAASAEPVGGLWWVARRGETIVRCPFR